MNKFSMLGWFFAFCLCVGAVVYLLLEQSRMARDLRAELSSVQMNANHSTSVLSDEVAGFKDEIKQLKNANAVLQMKCAALARTSDYQSAVPIASGQDGNLPNKDGTKTPVPVVMPQAANASIIIMEPDPVEQAAFEAASKKLDKELNNILRSSEWGRGLEILDEAQKNDPAYLWMPWASLARQRFEETCRNRYEAEKSRAERLLRDHKPYESGRIYEEMARCGIPAYTAQAQRRFREIQSLIAMEEKRLRALLAARDSKNHILTAIEGLESDSTNTQKQAFEKLVSFGEEAVPFLEDSLDHENAIVRWLVLRVLNEINAPNIRKCLLNALNDANWRVRSGAADLLGSRRELNEQVLDALVQTLRDEDMIVSATANLALVRLTGRDMQIPSSATPDQRELVIKAWEKWMSVRRTPEPVPEEEKKEPPLPISETKLEEF